MIFLGSGFISMSQDFTSALVVKILEVLIQIAIIKLHRAMHELNNFTTVIEDLLLIMREYIFITKRPNITKIKQDKTLA